MSETQIPGPDPVPVPAGKRKGMPPAAIRTIAYSCHFCALMTLFLAFYAYRMGFPMFFMVLNVGVAVSLIIGANWMLAQLSRLRDGVLDLPDVR